MQASKSPFASSGDRSVAYIFDMCAASLLLLPAAYACYITGASSAGAKEFAAALFAYHFFFLKFKGGCSIGKYLRNISVVNAVGRPPSLGESFLRAFSISAPWLSISLDESVAIAFNIKSNIIPTLGIAWLCADILCLEFLANRRTLSDRLAGTIVIDLPPIQPHRAPAVPMYSADDNEFGGPPRK